MIDGLPPETKMAGVGGLLAIALAVLRMLGLRASKDVITLKADSSERDAFDRLQKRIEQMDRRIADLEGDRNHLYGFVTKCMAYVSQCQCKGVPAPTREELQLDYAELIRSLSARFDRKEKNDDNR